MTPSDCFPLQPLRSQRSDAADASGRPRLLQPPVVGCGHRGPERGGGVTATWELGFETGLWVLGFGIWWVGFEFGFGFGLVG
jgi:hypothetical protein